MRCSVVLPLVGLTLATLLTAGCGGSSPSTPSQVTASAAFTCAPGQTDMMTYFVMNQQHRAQQFMSGQTTSIYTEVFPNLDFASTGYWFWLKSPEAHGFDVKAFDPNYIYIRSTELTWNDNTTLIDRLCT